MAEHVLPPDFREFLKLLNDAGQRVDLISLGHLRRNKRASGRHKDLDDLEHLPKRRAKTSSGTVRLRALRSGSP